MSYGIPYHGSKNRIAKWLVEQLPAADVLVDIFAGGCAVTHAAMLSGKYKTVIANDIKPTVRIFKNAIDGAYSDYDLVPTREYFNAHKDDDLLMSLLYSFGNKGLDYLWDKHIEEVKLHASRMLAAKTLSKRYAEYHRFISALEAYLSDDEQWNKNLQKVHRLQGLEGLQRLEGLERLQRLQGTVGLEGLELSQCDYKDVVVPSGAIVYADPPYKNTVQGLYSGFNHAEFEQWLADVQFPVYVSEFTCPRGCTEIACRERVTTLDDSNNRKKVTERIFVQTRFVDDHACGGE